MLPLDAVKGEEALPETQMVEPPPCQAEPNALMVRRIFMRRVGLMAAVLTVGTALVGCTDSDDDSEANPTPATSEVVAADITLHGWPNAAPPRCGLEVPFAERLAISDVVSLKVCASGGIRLYNKTISTIDPGFHEIMGALSAKDSDQTVSCPPSLGANAPPDLKIFANTIDGSNYHVDIPQGLCHWPQKQLEVALELAGINLAR